MKLDRWIALIFLTLSLVYGYTAYHYPLLPFERHMAFLPNTLPLALSIAGIIVALIILFSPTSTASDQSTVESLEVIKTFKLGQTLSLVGAMVLYALFLRPLGFLPSTVLFIVSCAVLLGERKWVILIPIAITAAFFVWYLVQQTLGIFLRPWPALL